MYIGTRGIFLDSMYDLYELWPYYFMIKNAS
jgi:hypothetical protein